MSIPMFQVLEIESNGSCNRYCNFCLRNSTPDRESVSSWFGSNAMPVEDFERVLDQTLAMGFNTNVNLSHYNEPLMDERLPDLARMVKVKGFKYLTMSSNGDFLNETIATSLDGVFNKISFALYHLTPAKFKKRSEWFRTLFRKTRITIANVERDDMQKITHYSSLVPDANLLAKKYSYNQCRHPLKRMIVNHKGDMLLCCDDLTGHFDLGNIADHSISELWNSPKHQKFVKDLQKPGGRTHPRCQTCPRK